MKNNDVNFIENVHN